MAREQVETVRRFNRTVTERIGVLHDEYLARARPLSLARLLWEIGPDGTEVRSLRSRLGLDSGYLSRQLRRLESDGLVTTDPASDDGRVRRVGLTEHGRAERRELDRASDDVATSILDPLTAGQRERLVAAMAEVERLLLAGRIRIDLTDPRAPEARYCLRRYVEELAGLFDGGFDPEVSSTMDDDAATLPRGLFVVATLHDEPVACGALVLDQGRRAGEVKRMWTSPQVRGLGLGRRLLSHLAGEAAARGVETLRLDTNAALTQARRLYESAGFVEVAPYNDNRYADHWYELDLRTSAAAGPHRTAPSE